MDGKDQAVRGLTEEAGVQGISIRDYLLILLKRRWLVLSVLVISICATAVYSLKQTPIYRSKATLYYESRGFELLAGISPLPVKMTDTYINSQKTILQSRALALKVIEDLNLRTENLTSHGLKAKQSKGKRTEKEALGIAEKLLTMVQIAPVPDTDLILVVFLTPNSELSMVLANAWADQYRAYSGSSDYESTQQTQELLAGEVKRLQKEIAEKQKLLQEYAIKKDVFLSKGGMSMGEEQVRALSASILEADRDRISKEIKYRDLQSRPRNSLPELAGNTMVNSLRSERSILERTYWDKLRIFKPDYPEMIRLRAQIDQIDERLKREIDVAYSEILAAARTEYNQAVSKENALKQQMEGARQAAVDGYRKEVDYDQLRQEIDNQKLLLGSLLSKRNQAGVSAQVQEKMPTVIKVIDRAAAATSPYSPNIKKNMLFSVLFGLVGGIVFAIFLELLDRSLKTPDDVEKFIQLPLLGVVPMYLPGTSDKHALPLPKTNGESAPAGNTRALELKGLTETQSLTAEALRSVRTSLLLSFPGAPPKSILVTSSRPSEGKTFIASNLAVTLAQLNKKVVIVDADLRNPRIHKVWGVANTVGLTNLLTTQSKIDSALLPTSDDRILIITSGSKSPRPAELIASARFDELMEELEQKFDHVIVDSPPLLPVTDSVILASKCSAVLMVIRGGETPRDLVMQAKKKLMKSNPVIAGAVLNCINLQDPYYYYSYYSYYKKYYGEDIRPQSSQSPPTIDQ